MKLKNLLKKMVEISCTLALVPVLTLVKLENRLVKGETVFVAFSKLLSLVPGSFGCFLRAAFYRHTLAECGYFPTIEFGTFFSQQGAWLGNNVYIGAYSILGLVHIGDNTLIASRVSVTSGRNQHRIGNSQIGRDVHRCRTVIGSNCWIGESSVVMSDVGSNSVVGGGSVVVKPIENNVVAAGNPARTVRRNAIDELTDFSKSV